MKKEILNGQYLLLLWGNLISRMGQIVYGIALSWWIAKMTGSTQIYGYILSASTLPVAIISPFSGVIADRFNKRNILVITDFINGIISIFIGIMAYKDIVYIPILIFLSFISGICNSLFKPSYKSIIPEIIAKEHLVEINSINTGATEIFKIISPMIGGSFLAIPSVGITGAFIFNGLSFIISAISECFIKYEKKIYRDERLSLFKDFKKGLLYLKNHSLITIILITSSIVNFFLQSESIILPLYINQIFNNEKYYTFLLTLKAIGGISGAIIISKIAFRKVDYMKLLYSCTLLTGVALFIIGISHTYYLICIGLFLIGLFDGSFNIIFFSYLQNNVDNKYLGRVFSLAYSIAFFISPISYLILGYIGNILLEKTFLICGVMIFISGILSFLIFKKNLDNMEDINEKNISSGTN